MFKSLIVHNANADAPHAQEGEASVREFVGPEVQDVLLLLPRLQPEDQGQYPGLVTPCYDIMTRTRVIHSGYSQL